MREDAQCLDVMQSYGTHVDVREGATLLLDVDVLTLSS